MSEPPTEEELRGQIIYYTCLRNCYGNKGKAGACCTVAERDWIIGPIDDTKEFIARLEKHLGHKVKYNEIFIEYEEGRKLFPEKSTWQERKNYPAMRVLMDSDGVYPCAFLSESKECTIQAIKPHICDLYLCDHLKTVLKNTLNTP